MFTKRLDNDHEIVPVLNKIDLPSSDPDKIKNQIEEVLGIDASTAVWYLQKLERE